MNGLNELREAIDTYLELEDLREERALTPTERVIWEQADEDICRLLGRAFNEPVVSTKDTKPSGGFIDG